MSAVDPQSREGTLKLQAWIRASLLGELDAIVKPAGISRRRAIEEAWPAVLETARRLAQERRAG